MHSAEAGVVEPRGDARLARWARIWRARQSRSGRLCRRARHHLAERMRRRPEHPRSARRLLWPWRGGCLHSAGSRRAARLNNGLVGRSRRRHVEGRFDGSHSARPEGVESPLKDYIFEGRAGGAGSRSNTSARVAIAQMCSKEEVPGPISNSVLPVRHCREEKDLI